MKKPSILLFLVFFALQVSSPADPARVDWEGAFYGQPGSVTRDPERRIVLVSVGHDNLSLVDKSSTPPSPFAGGQTALLVDSTPENPLWLRLCFRPFDGPEAPQGVAEFLLHPVKGRIDVQAGHQEFFWNPEANETYYVGNAALNVSLNPGSEPMVAGQVGETDSVSTVMAGESYRLTVKWDFAGPEPIVRIFLNGEILRYRGTGAPLNPALGATASSQGLNAFRITLGGPEDHLGRLFVGPMAAVLESTSDMEQAGDSLLAP